MLTHTLIRQITAPALVCMLHLYPLSHCQAAPSTDAAPQAIQALAAPGGSAMTESQFDLLEKGSLVTERFALPVLSRPEHRTLLDVQASKGEESLGGVQLGLVQRYRPADHLMLGLNAFYGAQKTSGGFDFQQVSLGGEIALPRQILRVYGWQPITGGETQGAADGPRRQISPTHGFDAEYEVDLPSPIRSLQPRAAVGYYFLHADKAGVNQTVEGFKARVEVQYHWLSAGVEWREDKRVLGSNWMGFLRASFPLGKRTGIPLTGPAAWMRPYG